MSVPRHCSSSEGNSPIHRANAINVFNAHPRHPRLIHRINPYFRISIGSGKSSIAAAGASAFDSRSVVGTRTKAAFKYKKGERLNLLISLDPKRQIWTVNRHDRTVCRQKLLALLTVNCHTSVCLVTN
jgi:hypothetical protein